MIKETQARTVAKAITYRVLAVIAIMLISLMMGASTATAGKIGLTVIIIGTVMYYIHERLWILSKWLRLDDGRDRQWRSILKTATYRILTMIAAFIVGKIFITDSNTMAAGFMIAQTLSNIVLFYIVERVYDTIKWGRTVEERTL